MAAAFGEVMTTTSSTWLAVCLTSLLTFATTTAHADDAAPVVPRAANATDAQRLQDSLAIAADSARNARTTTLLTGLVSGVILVPAGVVLARRPDDVSKSVGVGMTIGGSASLLVSMLSLRSSTMEGLSASFEELRASGVSNEELVRTVESRWADAAETSHRKRIVGGWISVGLGTVLTGAGLYMLFADPGVFGQSRNDQYTTASFLVGPGVPLLGVGLRALTQETTEETSWKAYRATTAPRPTLPMPALSLAPVRGGGVAAASFTF
jgi:hypothetical protein